MVHQMEETVKRPPMKRTMDEIKMRFMDNGHDQSQCSEVNWMIDQSGQRRNLMRVERQNDIFDKGPERHRNEKRSEYIVDELAFEPEHITFVVGGPPSVEFETLTLRSQHIETDLKETIKDHQRACV